MGRRRRGRGAAVCRLYEGIPIRRKQWLPDGRTIISRRQWWSNKCISRYVKRQMSVNLMINANIDVNAFLLHVCPFRIRNFSHFQPLQKEHTCVSKEKCRCKHSLLNDQCYKERKCHKYKEEVACWYFFVNLPSNPDIVGLWICALVMICTKEEPGRPMDNSIIRTIGFVSIVTSYSLLTDQHTHPWLSQIHLKIWTNTFTNLDKYI